MHEARAGVAADAEQSEYSTALPFPGLVLLVLALFKVLPLGRHIAARLDYGRQPCKLEGVESRMSRCEWSLATSSHLSGS